MKEPDLSRIELLVELGIMKTMAEKVINLIMVSTDDNLKMEVVKLLNQVSRRNFSSDKNGTP